MKRILSLFLVILILRIIDSFILRTDQGIIGELFVHKLAGVALLLIVARDIFNAKHRLHGVLSGLAIAGIAYLTAYTVEIAIAYMQGGKPSLQFYVTSYQIMGNTLLNSGVAFVIICIVGNIINVVMEDGIFRGLFIRLGERQWSFARANLFAALLFGIWHAIMPIRNYIDGDQSLTGATISALIILFSSFLFGVQLGWQYRISGSLWSGMTVHFINNTSANLLHVVVNGMEGSPTMRIAIAQTIMFVLVVILYMRYRSACQRL
ncbi:MAG: CPBP family intramembrane metalloprotease [Deferribacteraceae bacterium]|nr:CPBP family intramembrane metalloprotease [Deferribacteraceae bacterium]